MDLTKLLPTLPEWISIPVIIAAIVVTLWPKIISMIQALSASSRTYAREKQRLELLKLHYEIEAIKKVNELQKIDEEKSLPKDEQLNIPSAFVNVEPQAKQLNFWWRFGYGAVGSLVPILINLLLQDMHYFENNTLIILLGYLTRLVVFALIAGLGSAFFAKGNATKQVCFLIGLSISLLFSLVLAGIAQQSMAIENNVS